MTVTMYRSVSLAHVSTGITTTICVIQLSSEQAPVFTAFRGKLEAVATCIDPLEIAESARLPVNNL